VGSAGYPHLGLMTAAALALWFDREPD